VSRARRVDRSRWTVAVLLIAAAIGVVVSTTARGEGLRELPGPRLTFPTGLTSCPDGAIWIASTFADTLLRIDAASGASSEFRLELGSQPTGLVCDRRGAVWFAASGRGYVGRLEPGADKPKEFAVPSIATVRNAIPAPRALAIHAARDEVWFTIESDGIVGRVKVTAEPVRRGFAVTELKLGESTIRPNGIAVDGAGAVWIAELGADRLTRIDPTDDSLRRVALAPGSQPSGAAAAPDGAVWITLLGSHGLVRLDPRTLLVRAWTMPSRPSSPDAVVVDHAGAVWVSELAGNRLLRFEPATERFTSLALPVPRSAVRALAVDPAGRVWFVGSYSGRLGRVE
jgi:virginiamycin B lyase